MNKSFTRKWKKGKGMLHLTIETHQHVSEVGTCSRVWKWLAHLFLVFTGKWRKSGQPVRDELANWSRNLRKLWQSTREKYRACRLSCPASLIPLMCRTSPWDVSVDTLQTPAMNIMWTTSGALIKGNVALLGLGLENQVMNNFVEGVDHIVKCPPRREQSAAHSSNSSGSIPYLQGLDDDDGGSDAADDDDYVSKDMGTNCLVCCPPPPVYVSAPSASMGTTAKPLWASEEACSCGWCAWMWSDKAIVFSVLAGLGSSGCS